MKNEFQMKYGFLQDLARFFDDIGLVWKYALNGIIGGMVLSMFKKSKFWESFRQIIIGGVVAGYSTPFIMAKSNLDPNFVGFASFVLGVTGMSIIEWLYKNVVDLYKTWKQAKIIIQNENKDKKD